jgi:multidrug resistance protein
VRPRLTIGAGGLAVLLGALDAYVLVSLLTDVIYDLGIPINHLERATPLITGYLLGYIAGMPLLGRLSDRYGRRLVIVLCLAGFALGSAITALATSMEVLVAGRALQGLAGGALLPVTMALVADVFSAERRAPALGWIGAAQELGAVLGPLFGAGVAALIGWRGIFWLNIPLALLAAIAVWFTLPRSLSQPGRPRVDVVGGVLLAVSLGLFVAGLYNPDPENSVLPSWGVPVIIAGAVAFVLFIVWEAKARTKLMDPAGVAMRPFLASLFASLCTGAALMVTLVDIPLMAQTLYGLDTMGGTLLLTRFLAALPIGAIVGGLLIRVIGERVLTVAGLLVAAVAYWQIAFWPVDVLAARYGALPRLDVDLIAAGLGLGLVIAPLSAIVLRVVPAAQHGIASAAVVVARMMGMLVGIAGLSAWGFYRFRQLTADLNTPLPFGVSQQEFVKQMAAYEQALQAALRVEYKEIFLATVVICVLGALTGLLLGRRGVRADSAGAVSAVGGDLAAGGDHAR